ncbi:unnamed protein product [Caenorhabditis sp. 36 PRJEB53466]|nr:unnamed protein product [Caenorhabditis sp. 36 PRJEB53466]
MIYHQSIVDATRNELSFASNFQPAVQKSIAIRITFDFHAELFEHFSTGEHGQRDGVDVLRELRQNNHRAGIISVRAGGDGLGKHEHCTLCKSAPETLRKCAPRSMSTYPQGETIGTNSEVEQKIDECMRSKVD